MSYMEIAFLPQNSLKIKGKTSAFVVDPAEKNAFNAVLLLNKSLDEIKLDEEVVVIGGPGEYEVGGVKLTGVRSEADVFYSLNVEGVDVVVGKLSTLDKMQHKLKEHNIVVALCNEEANASFLTSLTSNVVIFYGEKAKEVAQGFGRENIQHLPKYTTTKEKLPQEVETVVLG